MVEVSCLILELLAIADIANQGFDSQRARAPFGVRGDLDPDRGAVEAAEAEQIVGDDPIAPEALEERLARLRIDEPGSRERMEVSFRGLQRIAEDLFEMRVRRDGGGVRRSKQADVDALMDRLEQPRERVGPRLGHATLPRRRPRGGRHRLGVLLVLALDGGADRGNRRA